jgi:hypothetical protein
MQVLPRPQHLPDNHLIGNPKTILPSKVDTSINRERPASRVVLAFPRVKTNLKRVFSGRRLISPNICFHLV